MRKFFVIVLFLSTISIADAADPAQAIQLQLTGSSVYGTATNAPVSSASLFVDSTNFDGKSGYVRLQKGLTSVYLVISSREAGCETIGAFEKKPFLQRNVTPMPKLPDLTEPSDYVLILGTIDVFNPRKQSTSTFLQAVTQQPITKLTSMAPWVTSLKVPSLTVDHIYMHIVAAAARTPSAPNKAYTNNPPMFLMGGTAIYYDANISELHLQSTRSDPPFGKAEVVLQREGDQWSAAIDIKAKEMRVSGTVPVRLCEPVSRTINEYAGKE